MKALLIAAAALGLTATPALAAETATAAAPAAAKFSTATSTIGDLLDNPSAKAVLAKHMAALVDNPQIEMARTMTLKQIQGMAGDMITDEVLAKVDADLAAIK